MTNIVSDCWLHGLDADELGGDLTSISEPDFGLRWAESRSNRELYKSLRKGVVNINAVISIICYFIVDEVVLGVGRPYLVSEDAAAAAFCVDLGVVEPSYLIEGNLTIGVQDQDGQ